MEGALADFEPWLTRWGLTPDGEPFTTPYTKSRLLAVRQGPVAAMLKLARFESELRGAEVMAWWGGEGAAPVLALEGEALLLERAQGPGDLVALARDGRDDEATTILCAALAALHRPRADPPAGAGSLHDLFRALRERASADPRMETALAIAEDLLAAPREPALLHGDMHHYNVLDFGPRGWLAIDPWGVSGERTYDYANLLRNPDLACAIVPGRFRRQLELAAGLAGLDAGRLALWSYAHSGLSAAWQIEDGQDPEANFQIMDAFAGEIAQISRL
jgi:streptomycin 6-kinase